MQLVCSVTEDYLDKAKNFLDTVNLFLNNWKTTVMCVDFEPPEEFFKPYKNIWWRTITSEQNLGAPEGTHSIQHGSFLPFLMDEGDVPLDNDIVVYCDCDIIVQRPFSWAEQGWLENFGNDSIGVGWNSGPNETLMDEAMRLKPNYEPELLREMWGEHIDVNPCFNIGIMVGRFTAWQRLYDEYMRLYPLALKSFGHMARQQWLMSWCMSYLNLDKKILPYSFHSHAHYELPEGVYGASGGIACYQDRIILFRHRF